MHNVADMTAPARTSSLLLLAFIGRPPESKSIRDTCEAAQKKNKLQREYSPQAMPAFGACIACLYDACQRAGLRVCRSGGQKNHLHRYEPRIKQNESLTPSPLNAPVIGSICWPQNY
jgi:hypothetical protein